MCASRSGYGDERPAWANLLCCRSAGPTTRTSSISTDVNNAAARGVTYDELVAAYAEQVRGLLDGGADALLVETIFDTLNAKAAFFAIEKYFDEHDCRVPVMASVTFIQAGSNRGVTGQGARSCDTQERTCET